MHKFIYFTNISFKHSFPPFQRLTLNPCNYNGDFEQTPVFFGTGNPDFHVPVERVQASANIAREMNANVTEKVYENRGHTISEDEIKIANSIVFK